ncbi:hypothetical protein PIB30_067148 [Stylosanthes scabra]|uniref:COPA/B TPR domain-containing protein n=1 Tax=Stylosanthes scabra TaxID=79078 RepID=A0ABU6YK29_9FABA|nr:hypothetical protein [Stylosanthes scabra]
MKSYRLSELSDSELQSLKARPRIDFSSVFAEVNPIVDDVRTRGDAAVKEYTWKFEKAKLDKAVEIVSELPDPVLDEAVKEAFDVAYNNIYAFHAAQKTPERIVENMKGVQCKRVARSINSVGLYVPGGTAVLPSTALMLSVSIATDQKCRLDMAEDCLNHAMDLSELLLLVEDCLQLLIERNQIPEAALLARSYLPSKVSEIVVIWRKDLNKVNPKAAESLAEQNMNKSTISKPLGGAQLLLRYNFASSSGRVASGECHHRRAAVRAIIPEM